MNSVKALATSVILSSITFHNQIPSPLAKTRERSSEMSAVSVTLGNGYTQNAYTYTHIYVLPNVQDILQNTYYVKAQLRG